MLKKSASGVLASLPVTVNRETRVSCGAAGLLGTRRVSARQGWAGEKSGLFEHPARFLEASSWQTVSLAFPLDYGVGIRKST